MLLAQLTDFHARSNGQLVSDTIDTNAMIDQAIDRLLRLPIQPDILLLSGDLTDCGLPDEYFHLRDKLSRVSVPMYAIPGNHDRRNEFATCLGDCVRFERTGEFFQYIVDLGPFLLIAIDTIVAGEGYGDLCDDRLKWLRAALDRVIDRPVVIMMHHPPGRTGITFMDKIGLRASDRLADVLERHPDVERIICGHVHRTVNYRWANTFVSISPSIVHHVALELGDGPPGFVLEPPSFCLHFWEKNQGLITHQVPVDDSNAPQPFARNPNYPGKGSALIDQAVT